MVRSNSGRLPNGRRWTVRDKARSSTDQALGCTSIEEHIFSCPPIRTLKCFSINIIRLWNGQTRIRAFKIRRRAGRTWKRLIAAIT
ncbi:hypothetical protein NQ317_000974 [Molorchus minor]|uniref:Uncharacterized protein n=1 Tax=Molorchus minor TaxID=1323400 RepID=A0ABQ9JN72_9CUCU|nr:hypothetical protein NQ317_000974 [Molorchus minor]